MYNVSTYMYVHPQHMTCTSHLEPYNDAFIYTQNTCIYICTCTDKTCIYTCTSDAYMHKVLTWSMTSGAIQHGVPTNVFRGFFRDEALPPSLS